MVKVWRDLAILLDSVSAGSIFLQASLVAKDVERENSLQKLLPQIVQVSARGGLTFGEQAQKFDCAVLLSVEVFGRLLVDVDLLRLI